MPFTSAQIQAAVNQLMVDISKFHDIVQGTAATDVSTDSGPVPAILKFYDQVLTSIAAGGFPGVLTGQQVSTSISTTFTSAENGKTFNLAGANTTLTIPAASGFSGSTSVVVVNRNVARGNFVAVSGWPYTPIRLWPQQHVFIQKDGSNWNVLRPALPRWDARGLGLAMYVSATGNDNNDGLASSAPLRWLQSAIDYVQFEIDGMAWVNLAAGTHTPKAGLSVARVTGPLLGGDLVQIMGDTTGTGQAAFVLECPPGGICVDVQDNGICVINGCKLRTTGNGSTLCKARQQSVIDMNGCDVDAAPLGQHINATVSASVNIGNNAGNPVCMNVLGAASTHVSSGQGSYINYGSFTVNIPSALAMGQWMVAVDCGVISNGGVAMTYSGAGLAGTTGTRHIAGTNGVIASGTTEPGNVAGFTVTGGQYG